MEEDRTGQDRPIRIGILGAAGIAKKNVRAIKAARTCIEVVALGSRSTAKAEAFVKDTGIDGCTVHSSYLEVLDDPSVDAVYIPLPTSMHVEWVRKAAARKKHILLEKPIAVSEADLEQIVAAVKENGVQFMDGTMWLHNPRTTALEARLQDIAKVAHVHRVETAFSFKGSSEFMDGDIRVSKELDALGALGDLGWYCIGFTLWAFGWKLPASVQAHPGAKYNAAEVVLECGATMVWEDGRTGVFSCGFHTAFRQNAEVAGSHATVSMTDFVIPENESNCSFTTTSNHGLAANDTQITTQRDVLQVQLEVPQETLMWETFAACIAGSRAGRPPASQWLQRSELTQRVCLAVAQSLEQGCAPVPLSPDARTR